MSRGPIVLSFHDTLLHKSDVELLDGPYWLNDTIISFYFEYLERIRFSGAKNLLFVSPEVTQCVKMVSTEDIGTFLDPLGIKNKKFTFFALNDNDRPEIAGGTHWSLLVFSQPENSFFHLDSSGGSNYDVAWDFASHLIPYFTRTGQLSEEDHDMIPHIDILPWLSLHQGSVDFLSKECVQQSNSYDCGVHVLCNTELIAEHTLSNDNVETCDMDGMSCGSQKRSEILDIIYQLAGKS